MGQLHSFQKQYLPRTDVIFYFTIGTIVAYYWWKKKRIIIFSVSEEATNGKTKNNRLLNAGEGAVINYHHDEIHRILQERKLKLEKLELQNIQLQTKNQDLEFISHQKSNEIMQLKIDLEITKKDYSQLLEKYKFEEQTILTYKEANENITKTLTIRDVELSTARQEIFKLREELDRARRSSSELMVDRMLSDLRSPRQNVTKIDTGHLPVEDDHNQESEISSEPDYDSEDEEDLWNLTDPRSIFKDPYLFESGGACVGGIWLAKDTRTGLQVVIKKIMAEKDDRPGYVHAIAKQEISIIKHLQTHPNIIDFYEAFMLEKGKEYWMVMEYMDSKTLFDIVTNHNYLTTIFPTEPQIARISVEIIKGLFYMHSKNVLHKDIKSENILFNEKMQIKLADFGNSTRMDEETKKAEPQEAVGTSYWMAPEIIAEQEHDGKVDIWSFGVVLYEMLSGLPPYNDVKDSEEVKGLILNDLFPPPWKQEDEWSSTLRSFYHRCIVKDPLKRASAEELLHHKFCVENLAPLNKVKELMLILESADQSNDDDEEDYTDSE